ncbi:hypothetical protein NC653_020293 [Populus alba x Populus x berolinensis]|uniref:Uncharacterized protein n=1 Tax=Populus alba x Populus x berolinensis TaxID=444605 RepID=A0AAD6QEC2_9ROSI|nr:hypothetical protein NC653_020293 [Populus alba x Populus x berolinensis]
MAAMSLLPSLGLFLLVTNHQSFSQETSRRSNKSHEVKVKNNASSPPHLEIECFFKLEDLRTLTDYLSPEDVQGLDL